MNIWVFCKKVCPSSFEWWTRFERPLLTPLQNWQWIYNVYAASENTTCHLAPYHNKFLHNMIGRRSHISRQLRIISNQTQTGLQNRTSWLIAVNRHWHSTHLFRIAWKNVFKPVGVHLQQKNFVISKAFTLASFWVLGRRVAVCLCACLTFWRRN